jgi:orotate phosphoribosyltransferase
MDRIKAIKSPEQKCPSLRDTPVLVNACLVGIECRYDGRAGLSQKVLDFLEDFIVIPVCPETLGGLERPRAVSELNGCTGKDVLEGRGLVIDKDGKNLTDPFVTGARGVLEMARRSGARLAILKERSPSCGIRSIYDGTFQGNTVPGMGVTAAILSINGIELMNEEEVERSGEMTNNEVKDARETLKALLLKNSIKFGDFTLTSGQQSNYYIDARLTTLDPHGASLIGKIIFDRIRSLDLKPDVIGGMTMGADPISMAVSMRSFEAGDPIQAIVVRKSQKGHGTKRRIEGNFRPGDRVVVVEDVGSSGGSVLEAVKTIQEEGGEVVFLFLIVDRMMGAMEKLKEAGLSVESVFRIDELLEEM